MFENILNNVKDKINTIKEENINYNNLLKQSLKFSNLNNLPEIKKTINEGKITKILEYCPDLNKEKAIIINNLIPLSETFLEIYYIKEIITNIDYWLIPTNKYLWVINEKSYGIIPYQNITTCNIVKNNLMSKSINLNNIILEINGNDEKINNLISILSNEQYRNKIIIEKTNYLCGITPIYQTINNISSGISIDESKNIVFHSKTFNYKYNYQDITNYELLLDNNCVLSKNQDSKQKITSFQNNCYSINIRITTKDTNFIIPILEPNALGKKYTNMDIIYQYNINFAKEIMSKLKELCEINYYS